MHANDQARDETGAPRRRKKIPLALLLMIIALVVGALLTLFFPIR